MPDNLNDRGKMIVPLPSRRISRAPTDRELNALTPAERHALVRAASGRQKHDLIIAARDAERLVRRLPVQEVYLLIKELGLVDVPELVALADTEQFTAFLDLDCWQGDILDGPAALEWMAALLDAGEEKVLEIAREMDFDLLALIFKKLVTVVRGPEDYLDEDARFEAAQRDGGFELAFRDSESAKLTAALLDILLRHDAELFSRVLGAGRWEQEAELEEENYRARNIRLGELGFPDPAEAQSVYAWLDPSTFDPGEWRRPAVPVVPPSEAPSFMLFGARPRDLLADVLAAGIDEETAWEFTFLLNAVMTADRVDVGDLARVQEESAEVYRTLNLALEHLCGSDAASGARLLANTWLQPLFRLGFSLTLDLQRRARKVKRSPVAPYLDGPFRALVDALDRRKPRFFEGMEDPTRGGDRPFGNLGDLRLAGEWLDTLEVQQHLFETKLPFELPTPGDLDLTGCVPDSAEDLALSDLLLTALANRILGRPFLPRPVSAADLQVLHGKICEQGKVSPELRRETCEWLDSLEPGAGTFGEFCLDIWEEDFCALASAEMDPRFVSGLLVRLD